MPRLDLRPIERGRSYARWALSQGINRAVLSLASRRGDPLAELMWSREVPDYGRLRARGPIHVNPFMAGTVSYAAANEILRSSDFGVGDGQGELPVPLRWLLGKVSAPDALGPVDPPSMLAVDPPLHTRYRKHVSKAFTARRISSMAEMVTAVAGDLLDEIDPREGRVDIIEEYAAKLPIAVIAELLGVPDSDRADILRWGDQAAAILDPGLSWGDYARVEAAMRSLHHWFEDHVRRLRSDPGDDLLSALVIAGDLDDIELHALGLLVLAAGFETTVNLIGNAVAALDAHPEQQALFLADASLVDGVVEETLRWDPPVMATVRQAYADTCVAGREVARGTAVAVVIGGANRDPSVFEDPDTYDITRADADQHLSFSAGAHFCLGASLARLEARVGLRLLFERFPTLHVEGAGVRRPTRILRGYASLPVAL
ncbi:cytochrome P450 [Nocardioides luteus]|uniref:cytochrome P450 n=1 Tax=Nocardioides luteus TaxID=1844 RepID=UPI0018CA3F87|nr:cytochrome P450 [Nocardioides luteus]MBG6099199.1 cytochrome P450 [Nocardioides luteus]